MLFDKLKAMISPKEEPKPAFSMYGKMIEVSMPDGTIQKYPEGFMITDGNCVVCSSDLYHTSLNCENLKWEMEHSNNILIGMSRKDAAKKKLGYCMNCSRENYLLRHGREDEIE